MFSRRHASLRRPFLPRHVLAACSSRCHGLHCPAWSFSAELWYRACQHGLPGMNWQLEKMRKEQMPAAGWCCHCSGLCMALPNWEANAPSIYNTQPLPFPLPSLQRLKLPFKVTSLFSPPFILVSSPTFSRSLQRSRLPILPILLHSITSPAGTTATSSSVLRLSVLSSLTFHSHHFSILTAFQSFCASGDLPSATLSRYLRHHLGILSRCDRQDAFQSVLGPSGGVGLAATCRCPIY